MPPFVTARRPTRTQGDFWDVKPYRWMSELRERYTTNVMVATRKRSETIAKEATEWMQNNAPWQDRTGSARQGLRAQVIDSETEANQYQSEMARAINADQMLKDSLETSRRERVESAKRVLAVYQRGQRGFIETTPVREKSTGNIYLRTTLYPYSDPNPRAAKALTKRLKTQRQYQRVTRVPKGRSAVAQFERAWKGQRSPLTEVRFRHNPKVTYAIWLEIANQGRYAIISRAVNYWGTKLFNEVKMIANLKQYRDKIALGPEVNPENEFWDYVDRESAATGRQYEGWSPRKQRERAQRRAGYDPKQNKMDRARRTRLAQRVDTSGIPISRSGRR